VDIVDVVLFGGEVGNGGEDDVMSDWLGRCGSTKTQEILSRAFCIFGANSRREEGRKLDWQ
jgi:hypothetical protein